MDAKKLTNEEYSKMNRKSLSDVRKLLGAINKLEVAKNKSKKVSKPCIEAECRIFNARSEVVLRDESDPLFSVYQRIGSTVPIVWDPTLVVTDYS